MKRWMPLIGLGGFIFVGLHLYLSFTLNVNGDEFALFERAFRTVRLGEVQGAGRPGLGTLSLVPFVQGCANAVQSIAQIRFVWTVFVLGGVAAFVLLLRQMLPHDDRRSLVLTTAVALWILAPPFLQYSVQVRTDQPAIGFVLWSGVALLASQRRPAWAGVAGLAFGIGLLFSQKAVYVGGLVGVLVLSKLLMEREFQLRRELSRAGLLVLGGLTAVGLYRMAVSSGSGPPELLSMAANMSSREYYRELFGFRSFRRMLPGLLAQVVVLGCVVIVSIDWLRDRGRHGAQIATAWGIIGVGTAILLFHTTRAPYFYMVLGLFPATAGALVIGPMLARLETRAERRLLLAAIWIPLLGTALASAPELVQDSQQPQREALAFVDRNFPTSARGFEAYSMFICRSDPEPFTSIGFRTADAKFSGPDSLVQSERFLELFRSKPVSFLVLPHYTQPFPHRVRNFWLSRYEHYANFVHVPGAALGGRLLDVSFEAVIPGEYRWYSQDGTSLFLDGRRIAPDESVSLTTGLHELSIRDGGSGRLLYDLRDPPSAAPNVPFYQPWGQNNELADIEQRGF